MQFEDITGDGRLWAVWYDGDSDNILSLTFNRWNDIGWLIEFFTDNKDDLADYFRITNLNQAVYDTLYDAGELECLILDINPDTDLNTVFRPLDNSRTSEMVLGREKAKGNRVSRHSSWLRLYAIKFSSGSFLITGGAIKLTRTMREREHTLHELYRMEEVRNFLLDRGVTDLDSFVDLINE